MKSKTEGNIFTNIGGFIITAIILGVICIPIGYIITLLSRLIGCFFFNNRFTFACSFLCSFVIGFCVIFIIPYWVDMYKYPYQDYKYDYYIIENYIHFLTPPQKSTHNFTITVNDPSPMLSSECSIVKTKYKVIGERDGTNRSFYVEGSPPEFWKTGVTEGKGKYATLWPRGYKNKWEQPVITWPFGGQCVLWFFILFTLFADFYWIRQASKALEITTTGQSDWDKLKEEKEKRISNLQTIQNMIDSIESQPKLTTEDKINIRRMIKIKDKLIDQEYELNKRERRLS